MKKLSALAGAALVLAAGCASEKNTTTAAATPKIASGRFVSAVTNPWFPLKPGAVYVYTGEEDGDPIRDIVTVTSKTKTIQGVRTTVVDDRVYTKGKLTEKTKDWYAQDRDGNVWYFGEDTAEIKDGKITSREGSWESGVNGARAGLFMPAHPKVGQSDYQEYSKGHAEDRFKVLSLTAKVKTPAGSSNKALLTQETTRLEPGILDHKLYIRGIGEVVEETIKGGNEKAVLQSVTGL